MAKILRFTKLCRNEGIVRKLVAAVSIAALAGYSTVASANYVLANGFAATDYLSSNFQNSTVLSVAVDANGNVIASAGKGLSTVPLNSTPSTYTPFPFMSQYQTVHDIGYDSQGMPNYLVFGFLSVGTGAIWRHDGGTVDQILALDSNHSAARSFAFDSSGIILISGTDGNANGPGWLESYDSLYQRIFSINFLAPTDVAFDSADQGYVADWFGSLSKVSAAGEVSKIGQLSSEWVGIGIGHVESFAINELGDFYFGVNLGQKFGTNSSAILRMKSSGDIDILAYGIGDIPVDLMFSADGALFAASFDPYEGSTITQISGPFSRNHFQIAPPVRVPEPISIALVGVGLLGVVSTRKRKPSSCQAVGIGSCTALAQN